MDIKVFSIVLFAAFTHALWNFFSKKSSGNLQVTITGMWMANIALFPVSLFLVWKGGLDPAAWVYIVKTAFAHILYYYCLNMAYRSGDISTVYPVARGCGVAGTALAAFFVLGERFSASGTAGIVFILTGVMAISLRKKLGMNEMRPIAYAIGVGLSTVLYSINDKLGVAYSNPVIYLNFKDMLSLILMAPFVYRKGIPGIRQIIREKFLYCAIIGFGAAGSYLLILYAFTLGKAGYISALREFSIVIGAVLGIVFLKEKLTAGKLAGIVLVAAGLVFIKLS